MKLSNEQNIGLSMAVFLADDNYDYDPRPNSVSTTGLLKSPRQIILSKRVETSDMVMDISNLVASKFGSAIHDGVEKAWLHGRFKRPLYKLGYSKAVIDRIVVNHGYIENEQFQLVKDPNALPLAPDAIPVYMEIRSEKQVGDFIVSGKFDFVAEGNLEDHKTTGVFSYMNKTKDEDYRIQGSIYRWLNPDLITGDVMKINYVFTDWSKLRSMVERSKGYPAHRMMSVPIVLMSLEETEKWVRHRLREIKKYLNLAEEDLPLCTKEELWQDDTVYKYYKNPDSKDRSTRNFTTFAEAQQRLIKDGNVGVIDINRGMAKACGYCNAIGSCSQAKQLIADGYLEV
jgi:hypothetical protein